jgi:hypothetical protein
LGGQFILSPNGAARKWRRECKGKSERIGREVDGAAADDV